MVLQRYFQKYCKAEWIDSKQCVPSPEDADKDEIYIWKFLRDIFENGTGFIQLLDENKFFFHIHMKWTYLNKSSKQWHWLSSCYCQKKRQRKNIRGLCYIGFACNLKIFAILCSVFGRTVIFFLKCSFSCSWKHVWEVSDVPYRRSGKKLWLRSEVSCVAARLAMYYRDK